ncbi:MAG TPA: MCP four helix bundle domain-containing protein, partial [Burkholderiaceae bacterium]|nr:MCP four helix bundle domain-containing protein [Burkholderiaceae bacterium]
MFNNTTVRTRLLTGFLLVALLGALVAAIGIYNMSKMNAQAERAYASDLLGISAVKEANINLIYVGRASRNVLLAKSAEQKATFHASADQAQKDMVAQLATARPLFRTEAAARLFAEVDKGVAEYAAGRAELMRLADGPDNAAAIDYLFGPLAARANFIDEKLGALGANKEKAAAASAAEAASLYRDSRTLMIVLVVCSLGAGIGIGLWITRSLTRQLGGEPAYAAEMAGAIARGELSQVIATRAGDQHSLLFAMETMRAALVKIVGQVRSGTDTIATASSQIAVGNMDLSSRTEEQASSLEETASSMEELTSTVRQNADNARQANGLAKSASEVAVRGGSVVADVVDTMASIN